MEEILCQLCSPKNGMYNTLRILGGTGFPFLTYSLVLGGTSRGFGVQD